MSLNKIHVIIFSDNYSLLWSLRSKLNENIIENLMKTVNEYFDFIQIFLRFWTLRPIRWLFSVDSLLWSLRSKSYENIFENLMKTVNEFNENIFKNLIKTVNEYFDFIQIFLRFWALRPIRWLSVDSLFWSLRSSFASYFYGRFAQNLKKNTFKIIQNLFEFRMLSRYRKIKVFPRKGWINLKIS